MEPVSLSEFKGFDWDEGNGEKDRESHEVSPQEAEQVFFSRALFAAFTLRGDLISVISARDMSGRERKVYQGRRRGTTVLGRAGLDRTR